MLARETPDESVEYFRESKGSQERAEEKRIKAWRRRLRLGWAKLGILGGLRMVGMGCAPR